ncbi:hypothetical protein PRZ48_014846 [Zasmidium cellare]|uniref:Uncharacterized protein n=1 Tax=Zasmidium cellare TaxID=395010 RepID=A0ABR0DXH2_ZASCE|nr:hypothetical protein PRZ48_014846 [Zasmidium cellare]
MNVRSTESIQSCVKSLDRSDILVNNAGLYLLGPVSDLQLDDTRNLFEVNVFSQLAVTQAFLPLLLGSPRAMIVNNISSGSPAALPFQGTYKASKAALAMYSASLRLELQPFGTDLRTGMVHSNLVENHAGRDDKLRLPATSIYAPAAHIGEKFMRYGIAVKSEPADVWAKGTVGDILKKNPPPLIWRGGSA